MSGYRRWHPKLKERFKRVYPLVENKLLEERFSIRPDTVRFHAKRFGVRKHAPFVPWEPWEEDLVRKHIWRKNMKYLYELLPHRSRQAIKDKRARLNGRKQKKATKAAPK